MRRSGLLPIVGGRAVLEAVVVACLAVVLHLLTAGREPLSVGVAFLFALGALLALTAVLAGPAVPRRSAVLTVGLVGAVILAGMLQPTHPGDAVATIGRIVGFGLLGELVLWRAMAIARSPAAWSEARGAIFAALVALAMASVVPGLDAGPLPALALLTVAAGGLALSLSRTAEELHLAGASRDETDSQGAGAAAFGLGALALALALAWPWLRPAVAWAGEILGPLLAGALFLIVLPLGYLAALLVGLMRSLSPVGERRAVEPAVRDPDLERQILESAAATQPLVFGAGLVIIGVIALVLGLVLIERLTRGRRSALPEGVTLERQREAGAGLRETLAALFPRAPRRGRAPRDDGSPAAAVRLLYWRFLALCERRGAGWRAVAETPGEHHSRIAALDPGWQDAAPLVRAFERLRYAEAEPAAAEVERARAAYREVASRAT